MHEIEHDVTREGKDLFAVWFERLRDLRSQLAVDRRINRLASGNFGDHKSCGRGVWELRIDFGPGLRIYYAISEGRVILLLCAGDKSSHSADIERFLAGKTGRRETMRSRNHDEYMAERYKENPQYAIDMLNAVLDDGDSCELLVVLRQMAKAYGGVRAIAEKAELNSTQIYRTLSAKGNPSLTSLTAVLKAMGLQLAIKGVATDSMASKVAPPRARKKPSRVHAGAVALVKAAR